MVLVGNAVTANDVVADPRYSHLKPDQVSTKLLSEYTMELKVKDDFEATKKINSIKEEYKSGVSGLVRIYNASGRTLAFSQLGIDWHGHMYKYPPDDIILNGQWSVFLHVKTAIAPRGSEACVIYSIKEEYCDIFLGWVIPLVQVRTSPTVYTEVNRNGYWSNKEDWDDMKDKTVGSSQHHHNAYLSFKSEANIGNCSSPLVNFIISSI